jgi:hypothetical protein
MELNSTPHNAFTVLTETTLRFTRTYEVGYRNWSRSSSFRSGLRVTLLYALCATPAQS